MFVEVVRYIKQPIFCQYFFFLAALVQDCRYFLLLLFEGGWRRKNIVGLNAECECNARKMERMNE